LTISRGPYADQSQTGSPKDASKFLEYLHDHLGPRLDVCEQVLYLYVVRHSRLVGLNEVAIGFKWARARMAS
jgi:hypothetical protein